MTTVIKGDSNINLDFSTGGRITGDFSNSTLANRAIFQSSTTNGASGVIAIPNGTGVVASWSAQNSSDPNNGTNISIRASDTDMSVRSGILGTGSYLPMTFYTGGSERMRLSTDGNLGLGVTPSAWGSNYRAFQIGQGGAINAGNNTFPSYVSLTANTYIDGTPSARYLVTGAAATNYQQVAGSHQFFTAPSGTAGNAISFTQAMTLDASGQLFVGVTSATNSANVNVAANSSAASIKSLGRSSDNIGQIFLSSNNGATDYGGLRGASDEIRLSTFTSIPLTFYTNASERARIDSSGNFMVAKSSLGFGVGGMEVRTTDAIAFTKTVTSAYSGALVINRASSVGDGLLVEFAESNTVEGTISVSGTTVSYNGGHLSRWAQTTAAKDDSLVKGTVLSNLDEMNVYTDADNNPVQNEQLNKVKVSDVEGDANVAGVFVNWTHDDAHNVDEINMAMTGDMIIRIAQGVAVQRGDLLMSAGDGTAKPQGDDIVRSKTVAKVTSNHVTCTYADGSYCVPCVLMAC
jgi:hypothetical protein